jgi:hypothetical protein
MTNISIKQTTPHISIRASGKQGPQGEKGDTGATGPQGPKGDPGTTDYNELENLPDLTLKADKATTYTKTEVDTALTGKANTVHTHTASDVTDFDTEVSNNIDVAANTAARHTHANKAILDATSASYTTADETKLDGIEAGAQVNTVTSVAGKTGAVTLDKADVGLSNVDNTSDADKPVSTATQTALNAKANASDTVNLTGSQTIAGVKTFTSAPIAPSGTSIGGVLHLTGTGFPNGVVSAPVGSIYIDTAVTNGASSWIKKSGTGNTGWQVLEGDTGWRRNDPANSWFLNGATPNADGDPGTRFRRYGNVVHFILGLTTPSGWTNGADFLAVPNGFRHPNTLGYMPGGYSTASSMAVVSTGTTMRFYSGVTSSARFQWTWITNDPWPTALPGIAA